MASTLSKRPRRGVALLAVPALAMLLAACSTYQPLALREGAPPPAAVTVRVDAASLPFPALATHLFDPSDGLDIVEVAMLAVVNNPELRLLRDDAAVAHAQAFSAGLLPDPQLATSGDLSNTAGPGSSKAFSFGLSYDIGGLLTRSKLRGAATREADKTDLTLLWQEWQVASQAQLLFVKQTEGRRQMAVLDDTRALFADRVRRTGEALARGLIGSDVVTPNLTALQDVERQRFDLERQLNQGAHDLNAVLGLAPDTVLVLQEGRPPRAPDAAQVVAALAELPQRRPDLRALASGFDAQDARYRGALLAQFPALNVGLTRARDSSFVYSNALGITLALPILNRNRGAIAIEQASRQKLFDEYQVRAQAARNEVARIVAEQALNLAQQAKVDADLDALTASLARSDSAFKAGNADALAYAAARSALLAKQLERIALRQAVLEQAVGLRTLLGIDLNTLESTQP
jgi:outer membrane protein TolC